MANYQIIIIFFAWQIVPFGFSLSILIDGCTFNQRGTKCLSQDFSCITLHKISLPLVKMCIRLFFILNFEMFWPTLFRNEKKSTP